MRFLFLGDVVGRAGRDAVGSVLPRLRQRWQLDFVVVNGENSAGGFGIPRRSITNCSTPAPMPSRSAIMPSTKRRL